MPIPGSLETIAHFNRLGIKVVVATNQSGIGRGLFTVDTLLAIHDKMQTMLEKVGGHIDVIYFCPHHPADGCDCRKPNPGLLLQIQRDFNIDLTQAIVVGDSLRDMQAAQAVGACPVLVKTGKGERTLAANPPDLKNIPVLPTLSDLVETW